MKSKINLKILAISFIALGFVGLAFFVNPYFLIGAIILMLINQKEILRKR